MDFILGKCVEDVKVLLKISWYDLLINVPICQSLSTSQMGYAVHRHEILNFTQDGSDRHPRRSSSHHTEIAWSKLSSVTGILFTFADSHYWLTSLIGHKPRYDSSTITMATVDRFVSLATQSPLNVDGFLATKTGGGFTRSIH